jgi:epoxyqueuosine reductase
MAGSGLADLAGGLKAQALALGFAYAGLTTPDPPPHLAEYEAWLAEGCHGEMNYLATGRARQRRADPRQSLAGCRSILVVALPYTPGDTAGPVAGYARGADYHDVLPARLARLHAWLEAAHGGPIGHRLYTDTGPLLERELAQRAGLGWIGKNTLLINPSGGSYFLLGELLLDLALPPDLPFNDDRCGACTRCVEACPTQAIRLDRSLDARRCISYLTIELKGSIPEALRPDLGGWVFGCDICQAVCPWNQRFAEKLTPDPDLAPRPAPESLSTDLALTPAAFSTRFKGSPIKRARRSGYLRSVAVALGNQGGPRTEAALRTCLEVETDPLIREHAAWALARIEPPANNP